MKSSFAALGGIAGLLSGLLASYVSLLSFAFAGTVFAICMVPVIAIWMRRSLRAASAVWLGTLAFILLATAAPWIGVLAYIGADRTLGGLKVGVVMLAGNTSTNFLIGTLLGIFVWVLSLWFSLKLMTGQWDGVFVVQLMLAGTIVLSAAWGMSVLLPERHHAFDITLNLCGLAVSGLFFGVSLGRSSPGLGNSDNCGARI